MIKIDIFSGFLGAGKTTLIKKLISEAFSGDKVVLIENEFGEIGIDSGFLKEAGIEITEMNSGCICCSLVGDFGEALRKVIEEIKPDRILIEPSGVGKLSDVIKAVKSAEEYGAVLNSATAVVDASKCKVYLKNFGEFFGNQIECASAVVFSCTANIKDEKLAESLAIVKELNHDATVVTTDWNCLDGKALFSAVENNSNLEKFVKDAEHHHHHHHDEECECGHHHHHHHDEECECGHHHHHHDEECECGHHHHHHHDEECECGHHHHHHHDADEVFTSWGIETAKKFTKEGIKKALSSLEDSEKFGVVLRAKGLVAGEDGGWIYFDYVPSEIDIREGSPDVTGRLCVIGSALNKEAISQLF